jgi:hypothetical protein
MRLIAVVFVLLSLCASLFVFRSHAVLEGNTNPRHKFGVMSVFKNETMNLRVWIEHYLQQGASKLYLTDNGSTDEPLLILQPYIDAGVVEYTFDDRRHMQTELLRSMFRRYHMHETVEWLLSCDLDEFVFATQMPLVRVLDTYMAYDVIYMNWYMFGSHGYVEHPEDIRVALTTRLPSVDKHTKCIMKTASIKDANDINVHEVNNLQASTTENERIRLYHYPIQSRHFFENVKMTRGDVSNTNAENVRDWSYFHKYDAGTDHVDLTLHNLVLHGYA